MAGRRYTLLLADRSTGAVHRLTVALVPVAVVAVTLLALPILIGLGARWSVRAELAALRATAVALEQENASYRAATAELAGQVGSLQSAVSDLAESASLDPASARAMGRLPDLLRARASGGAVAAETSLTGSVLSAAFSSPENTFGALRDLLGTLDSRLRLVRGTVERRRALASATPSIWPAHGWLTAGFGRRSDPFTGAQAFHPALDISADRGQPVYATAEGTVESAAYSGAYGNLVVLTHAFGLGTRYAHLSGFRVKAGDRVQRGDVLGYVGATGRATGAHVHYEIWADGRPVNPLQLLTGAARR